MKLSARTEYACLAVMSLAENWSAAAPVQIRRIAEEQGIPARFLVQILSQLKGGSLVTSIRGAGGGYRLNKAPTEITLLDVIETMEGDSWPSTSCDKSSPLEKPSSVCGRNYTALSANAWNPFHLLNWSSELQ